MRAIEPASSSRPSRLSREPCGDSCPSSPPSAAGFAPHLELIEGDDPGRGPLSGQRRPAAAPRAADRGTRRRGCASPAGRGRPGRGRIDPRYARHRPRHGPRRSALGHPPRRFGHGRKPAPCRCASWVCRRWRTRSGDLSPVTWSGAFSTERTVARTRSGSRCSARRRRSSSRSGTSAATRGTTRSRGPPPRERGPGRSRPGTTRLRLANCSQGRSPRRR